MRQPRETLNASLTWRFERKEQGSKYGAPVQREAMILSALVVSAVDQVPPDMSPVPSEAG